MRGFFKVIRSYLIMRLPVHYLATKYLESNVMDTKGFLVGEVCLLILGGLLASGGGCLLRYLHEEVIHPHVDPAHLRTAKNEKL